MKLDPKTVSALELASSLLPTERGLFDLDLSFGDLTVRVLTNSRPLLHRLGRYYEAFHEAPPEAGAEQIVVHALDRDTVRLDLPFQEWPRDPGKTGRKEQWCDVVGGRVVRKVRTGLQYLLAKDLRIAFGKCRENDNQVINFINTQYINHHLHRSCALGHASGVANVDGSRALAIAAGSGGGKSTVALHLMQRGARFMTNDRALFLRAGDGCLVRGVPKLPRINPGTVLHNRALQPILAPKRRKELKALTTDELWELEEKYDVNINLLFPDADYVPEAALAHLFVLNWDRGSEEPTRLQEVSIEKRPDLLPAVMKSPGPFYMFADGSMPEHPVQPEPADYRTVLDGVRVVEISGGVDFDSVVGELSKLLDLPEEAHA